MLPYFHDTAVAVIDDDPTYLESFMFRLSPVGNLKAFQDPEAAVRYLIMDAPKPPSIAKYVERNSENLTAGEIDRGDRVIHFHGHYIRDLQQDRARSGQVSVIVVDYNMPKMNGLQVCRAIQPLPCRKVLLTGKATKSIGIDALNSGLIDAYFEKQDEDLSTKIQESISFHKKLYFQDLSSPLVTTLKRLESDFLDDEDVIDVFERVCQSYSISEYFLTTEMPGFQMRDAKGDEWWLGIFNKEELELYAELVGELDSKSEVASMLRAGQVVPNSPANVFCEQATKSNLSNLIEPATAVGGDGKHFYTVARRKSWTRSQ
ncbi:MAG: response regulator [Pseudomonadota bacterium]